jgi:hypothetical protein
MFLFISLLFACFSSCMADNSSVLPPAAGSDCLPSGPPTASSEPRREDDPWPPLELSSCVPWSEACFLNELSFLLPMSPILSHGPVPSFPCPACICSYTQPSSVILSSLAPPAQPALKQGYSERRPKINSRLNGPGQRLKSLIIEIHRVVGGYPREARGGAVLVTRAAKLLPCRRHAGRRVICRGSACWGVPVA